MHIEYDPKLDYEDVLFRPMRSKLFSRKEVNLVREFNFPHSNLSFEGIPIIAANMDHTGTFEVAEALHKHRVSTALHKHYSINELHQRTTWFDDTDSPIFYSMGISDHDVSKLEVFSIERESFPAFINVDIANGYSEQFAAFIKKLRGMVGPNSVIMAGNVVTSDMTQELILAGADIIKVGIGPGSVCTTRRLTGVGYPQLSAVIECANVAHGLDGLICADGGCKVPGDVAKAFGAGADFVMLGGMLAGHNECSGEMVGGKLQLDIKPLVPWYEVKDSIDEVYAVVRDGVEYGINGHDLTVMQRCNVSGHLPPDYIIEQFPFAYKVLSTDEQGPRMKFYGMSSDTAMNKYAGGVAEYRASEGKTVEVPYKGPITDTIKEILGGVRSTCTYVGARRLKDLSKCTTFVLVGRQLNNKFGD